MSKRSSSILYLTYDGLNDPLGQSQILPYLEGLTGKGYDITVITFEKSETGKQKSEKQKSERGNLKVIPLRYHRSPPVVSTLYDLYLLKKTVKKIVKTQQINIIHCRSYITSLVGLWAKRKYGVKFIFDMRGFWADERVEGGLWNLNNPVFNTIYKYFKRKEKQFFLESDTTISLTQNAKYEIEQNIVPNTINKSTNQQIRVKVIPTCTDLELFNPDNNSQSDSVNLRENLGIGKEDFVLLYLGSLGTWYMLEEMLDFFENLKFEIRNQKSVKFLFLTREQEEVSRAFAKRDFNENEFIITSATRAEVPKYIAICDASIFFIIPTYSKKASAATKMGEIMAMGKPVITNTGWGDVESIISETGSGVLVDTLSMDRYRKAIHVLNSSEFDSKHIREQARKYFSLEQGVEKYSEIYQNLLAER